VFEEMLQTIIDQFRNNKFATTAFYWVFNQFIFKEKSLEKLHLIRQVLIESLDYLQR
jgi:hypothetical protein